MKHLNTLSEPRHEPEASGDPLAYAWAVLSGLLLPVLIVLVGFMAAALNQGGLGEPTVRLGTHLYLPLPASFVALDPLIQLSELVAITFAIALLFCFAVWRHRRSADARAGRIVKSLHARLLTQSLRRAETEGAAAQHVHADALIGEHLPRMQSVLSLWYRSIPRSILIFAGCVVVALMVNVWLALIAVVSGVLVWQLYQRLHDTEETDLSRWEVPRTRKRMAELVGQAPLLARLQAQGLADQAFSSELDTLYRRLDAEERRKGRTWPTLFFASAIAVSVLVLGLGVNLFDTDNGLSLPSALTLGLALAGAVAAVARLSGLRSQLNHCSDACDSVYSYLRRSEEAVPSEQRVGLAGLREGVEIRDLTLSGSDGKPILSHLSLELARGSFVALLGTESVSTRSLTELLMGFGRPAEGEVLIDGISLRGIHPQALARNVMWIDPAGPIWDGTIHENLRGGVETFNNSDIVDALEAVDSYERLQRLPEGLNTFVSAGDTTLGVETTYAIGIARALLHKPPIVLAKEPPPPAEHIAEDPCLKALRRLVDGGTLVVILPRRLQTLRTADRVVLFNGDRLVGEGRHAELIGSSDLYRHMNYLLFNPYRHQNG